MLALPGAALAQSGGAIPSAPPTVTATKCAKRCTGTLAQLGSTLRVDGDNLQGVREVAFLGGMAPGDEASAPPVKAMGERLTVTVPPGAASGPIMVTDAEGQTSVSEQPVQIAETAMPKQTSGPVATALTLPNSYFDGPRAPTLAYQLNTDAPSPVTVTVVGAKSGRTIRTFDEGTVAPGETRTVSWGRKAGRFRFVVSLGGADVSGATMAQAEGDDFRIRPYLHPLAGKHSYGDGLGASRGHQGTDVFARCGMPIRAARGGEVKFQEFQGRAGNYIVIDQTRTGMDSAYMHLRDPALFSEGDRVRTGDVVGYVGDTGAASECHLHFELWGAPGWYSGGSPIAMSRLKRWDRF